MLTELLVLCLFAFNPILYKYALNSISIESVLLFSGLVYFIISIVFLLMIRNDDFMKDIKKIFRTNEWLWLILLIIPIFHVITHYFYFHLIRDNKTYLATALMSTYPLLTALFGFWFLGETVEITHIIGVIFIIMGVILIKNKIVLPKLTFFPKG